MSTLGACFRAERVKWRKSWLLVTAVLAPLCQVGFLWILFWFSENRIRRFVPGSMFWLELNFVAWNVVLVPVLAALLCELSWGQEREARAWNLSLIQPVPRHIHYLVKVLSHLSLVLLAQALLAGLLLLGAWLLRHQPGLLMGPLPWGLFLKFTGYSVLASAAVVAFQTWLSLRAPGFWTGLAGALGGTWLAVRLVGESQAVHLLPWGLAAHATLAFERWRVLPWAQAGLSLLSAGLLVILGCWDFTRRPAPRD